MNKSIALLSVCLLSLVGCGMMQDVEGTLREVEKTNDGIVQTNDKIDKTNIAIEKTNAAVHLQTLSVALNALTDPKNTEMLTPPTGMIPFAKAFADEATPHEIIQTFHMLVTEVLKGFDAEESGDKRIQARMVRLTAASAIAALAPREKAKQIIEEQIEKEGEFLDSAYLFGLCRYNFTRDYILKPVLSPDRTPTLKLLTEATEAFKTLRDLSESKHVEHFQINAPELIVVSKEKVIVEGKEVTKVTYGPLEDKLDIEEIKKLSRSAVRKFDNKELPKMQTPEAQELIQSFKLVL